MKAFLKDPALPGINTALDVDAVLELFRSRLPEFKNDFDLNDAKIIDVQYKPGVSCKLLYRLKARNRQTNRTTRQLISASLLRTGEAPPALQPEVVGRYKVDSKTILRTPVVYFPELQMIAYAFPVDPALPWLSEMLDPSILKREMQRNWGWRNLYIRKVLTKPIGYTPQARAAIFCEIFAERKDTNEPEIRHLIGKIHGYKPAALLFSGAWALWRAANHKIRLAPPVGYLSSLRLTFQEQVRGQRLTEFAHMASFVKPVRKTAWAIARVHGLSVPLMTVRDARKEASVIHRWESVLAAICPEEAERIKNLSDRIADEVIKRTLVQGPVHGDFHPANVMWDGEHVTLVDLDDFSYGDPLVDVGRFLASLRVSALRVSSNLSALSNAGEAFLQQYFKKSPGDEKRARLFEAASLLIAACAPFRLQRPGWKEAAVLLLEEAERVWESSRGASVATSQSLPAFLSKENAAKWPADGVYMRTILDPYVNKIHGADLVECRVIDRERKNEDEFSYELSGWRSDQKWRALWRGKLWQHRGGCAVVKRLEALRKAMMESSHAPILPRPIAYLRPFSLIVWEPPPGIPFSNLNGSSETLQQRAAGVARALAILHSSNVEINSNRSQEDEIRAFRRGVQQLERTDPVFFTRASNLLKEVEQRIGSIHWQYSPVLHSVHPKDVLFQDGGRVAFAGLQKLTRSHPFIDVADFLARLTLMGIRQNKIKEAEAASSSFREVYIAESAKRKEDLIPFEVAAIVRLACRSAETEAAVAGNLLDTAMKKMGERGANS